jgi:hypothetical protein
MINAPLTAVSDLPLALCIGYGVARNGNAVVRMFVPLHTQPEKVVIARRFQVVLSKASEFCEVLKNSGSPIPYGTFRPTVNGLVKNPSGPATIREECVDRTVPN